MDRERRRLGNDIRKPVSRVLRIKIASINMAVPLKQEEEAKVQKFIEDVSQHLMQNGKQPVSWSVAVKFLMARKFDLRRAIDLYRNHQATREREGLLVIDTTDRALQEELCTEKFSILGGRDLSGAAVALFTARLHHPPSTSHQTVLKALIHQLDAALESHETQRHGLVFIYDMTDSKYIDFDYNLSIKILNMLKGGYPARLKKVLIVTAPLWFKAPFKILRLFVREKLRDRVFTINLSQLSVHIPRDSIPLQLGGLLMPNHKAWLQICFKVASGEPCSMDSYFISCRSARQGRESIQTSLSSDNEINNVLSDLDSEESKETVSEKYNDEEKEKEAQERLANQEKEVVVEKENVDTHKLQKSESRSSGDTRKRSSDTFPLESQSESADSCKRRPLSADMKIFEESLHVPEEGGMTVVSLVSHVKSVGKKGLHQEYLYIRAEAPSGTFNISKSKYNLPKNRYMDVLCYDHSRVILSCINGDSTSDYINANFVDGYKQKNAYISTQGCLPKTFGDYWRMVWEQQCLVIVMTTRILERNRAKCGQYWPALAETHEVYDNFMVYNVGVECLKDYTITTLFLHNMQTDDTRQIKHLQFISWPDYGVPPAGAFLDFLFKVRACQAEATESLNSSWYGHPLGPAIVVHCSAGIGRTGTFITIDISIRRLEDIGTIDLYQTVRRIRSQRAFSIQVPDQYVFCHLAIVEHAIKKGLLQKSDWTGFDSESESD